MVTAEREFDINGMTPLPDRALAKVLTGATKGFRGALTDGRASSMLPESFSTLEISPATVSEILQTHVARIFIPQKEPRPTELCVPIRPERRRTPRRHLPIPLFVYGHTPEGNPFYEETFTSAVNVHGGSMRMETSVQLGQRLLVTNEKNDCAQPCIVVFVETRTGCGVDVAFSFTAAMPYFWRNPGANGSSEEVDWDYVAPEPSEH